MHIIFGDEIVNDMKNKYTILPLDDMKIGDAPIVTAYCLVTDIPVTELPHLERTINLHNKLVDNYKKPDFNFCEEALTHLKGKWNRQLDSFYDVIAARIVKYKDTDVSQWDPVVYK